MIGDLEKREVSAPPATAVQFGVCACCGNIVALVEVKRRVVAMVEMPPAEWVDSLLAMPGFREAAMARLLPN